MGSDPFDLARFLKAQEGTYGVALEEISRGDKVTHWMWFIFPQFAGLGYSSTSRQYAIKSIEEAKAYLRHPVLGARLRACAEAALRVERRTAEEIFGDPDDMKLRSSATLFAMASEPGSAFHRLLVKYFDGEMDRKTMELLERASGA